MNKYLNAILVSLPFILGLVFTILCDTVFKFSSTFFGYIVFIIAILGAAKIGVILERQKQYKIHN